MTARVHSAILLVVVGLALFAVACGNDSRPAIIDQAQAQGTPGSTAPANDGPAYGDSGGAASMDHRAVPTTEKEAAFHDGTRKLWEDHVTWTRLFIVSDVGNLPDLQATTTRLLQNQVDIGDAVKPYYGQQAGDALTVLLQEHITTAAKLLDAAEAGDQAGVAAASASWYDNADRIASFLSTANPNNWPLDETKAMMREHLDLTLQEATAHLTGDYAADIAAYDKIHGQILEMADMLSSGIIAQFPNQFH